jgi:hypothetical protein
VGGRPQARADYDSGRRRVNNTTQQQNTTPWLNGLLWQAPPTLD